MTSGSSFYDTINKLLIGFLILLPWINYTPNMGSYEILVISVLSYVAGIFFWGLVDGFICYRINWSFLKNNCEKWIAESFNKIMKYSDYKSDADNIKDEYYKAYYTVQERGLLGPVNIMEGFSAFFRNFIFVSIYWIIIICTNCCSLPLHFGPICICLGCNSCSCGKDSILQITPCCAIVWLLVLVILSPFFRCIVEKKIQCTVLNAYKYILNENKSN